MPISWPCSRKRAPDNGCQQHSEHISALFPKQGVWKPIRIVKAIFRGKCSPGRRRPPQQGLVRPERLHQAGKLQFSDKFAVRISHVASDQNGLKSMHHAQRMELGRRAFRDSQHVGSAVNISHRHGAAGFQHVVDLPEVPVDARPVAVEMVRKLAFPPRLHHRRIWQIRVLRIHIGAYDPEPVDSLFQPEFHGTGVDGPAGVRVLPVETWLAGAQETEVVLLGLCRPIPRQSR
jgi:hypothetical protein